MEADDVEARKLFCGNLDSQVDEELLYELFLQAGPLERIQMPRDRNGGFSGYCFVTFKHECSVPYAIELFEDTALFGKLPKLGFRRVPNHQRTQSAPVNFNSNTAGSSSHMDFDCLLQMSKNMLNPGSSADTPTEPRPLVGGPLMGMGPPPMGGPMMRMGHPHMARPNMRPHTRPHHRGNPWRNDVPQSGEHSGKGPPWAAHSDNRNKLRVQPVPPGEEEADCGQDWSDGTHGQDTDERNISSNALSHSSLQGNWSTRNSSHMLPADGHRRTDHFSRRGRGYPSHNNQDYYDRDYSRGNYKNREYEHGDERYDNNYHPRNRSQDRHHDKGGYRSRSNDARDRKGRY